MRARPRSSASSGGPGAGGSARFAGRFPGRRPGGPCRGGYDGAGGPGRPACAGPSPAGGARRLSSGSRRCHPGPAGRPAGDRRPGRPALRGGRPSSDTSREGDLHHPGNRGQGVALGRGHGFPEGGLPPVGAVEDQPRPAPAPASRPPAPASRGAQPGRQAQAVKPRGSRNRPAAGHGRTVSDRGGATGGIGAGGVPRSTAAGSAMGGLRAASWIPLPGARPRGMAVSRPGRRLPPGRTSRRAGGPVAGRARALASASARSRRPMARTGASLGPDPVPGPAATSPWPPGPCPCHRAGPLLPDQLLGARAGHRGPRIGSGCRGRHGASGTRRRGRASQARAPAGVVGVGQGQLVPRVDLEHLLPLLQGVGHLAQVEERAALPQQKSQVRCPRLRARWSRAAA